MPKTARTRFLRIASLSLLALCLAFPAPACQLRAPSKPATVRGVSLGLATQAQVEDLTGLAEKITGGKPKPSYMALPRIYAYTVDKAGHRHPAIAAVVEAPIPPAGAEVEMLTRYIDPDNACQFIPWTLKSAAFPVS